VRDDTQTTTTPVKAAEATSGARLEISAIAREHYDAVYRFCARRVGPDHAADAAQEAFLTAQKALKKFRGESSLTTWLFGIAHNECRRIARKERLAPLQLDIDVDRPAHTESEQAIVNRQALREAMRKLSDEHREVVVLHELDGLTYEEAAVILGVPVGTVKSRLHHAFLNLRKSLLPGGGDA
jgi:RNA polymerase sigma-70 factor (ECF subfamily)